MKVQRSDLAIAGISLVMAVGVATISDNEIVALPSFAATDISATPTLLSTATPLPRTGTPVAATDIPATRQCRGNRNGADIYPSAGAGAPLPNTRAQIEWGEEFRVYGLEVDGRLELVDGRGWVDATECGG